MPETQNPVERLRERIRAEGEILWISEGRLGIFDPAVADRVDTENFRGLAMPDRLSDLLGLTRSVGPVLWDEVRAAIIGQARRLNGPEPLLRLRARMRSFAAEQTGREMDLTWFADRLMARTLLPVVIDGLTPAELEVLRRDQEAKVSKIFLPPDFQAGLARRLAEHAGEMAVGRVLRRVVADRARGTRPAQQDLAEGVMSLHERLGTSRTAYAIATVLSAVAGAPGPVGACLMCEYLTRPDWRRRLEEELCALSPEAICEAPVRRAPRTHRFVQEVLRLWSFPTTASRPAKKDLAVGGETLKAGQTYTLSAYVTHRNPSLWPDAEVFDPDRWLTAGAGAPPGAFAPFGWGARTCMGAALGLSQLILLCHLLATEVEVTLADDARPEIRLGNISTPRDFRGRAALRPRAV
jgi:cytochrome P450